MFNCKNASLPNRALLYSSLTFVYILLIASFLQAVQTFSPLKNTGVWGPAAFLLLFVISAAVTGSLVLGKPTLMYLDGQKKEAVQLFFWTVGYLFFFFVLAGVLILVMG